MFGPFKKEHFMCVFDSVFFVKCNSAARLREKMILGFALAFDGSVKIEKKFCRM